MTNLFDEETNVALTRAREVARDLRHGTVGSEHLLLALLGPWTGSAAGLLKGLGVSETNARKAVLAVNPRGRRRRFGPIPYGLDAKDAMSVARAEALRLGQGTVGTGHLLLALAGRPDSPATRALGGLGVDSVVLRQRVFAAVAGPVDTKWLAASPPLEEHADTTILDRSERTGLTTGAQVALGVAASTAMRMRHGGVGTDHLLVGMMHRRTGIASAVLAEVGPTLASVLQCLQVLRPPGERPVEGLLGREIELDDMVVIGQRLTRPMGDGRLTASGLLHVIARRPEVRASRMLDALGVDRDRLRASLFRRSQEELALGGDPAADPLPTDLVEDRSPEPVLVSELLDAASRRALVLAMAVVREMRHTEMGTDHLVLGMLWEGDDVAARALAAAGLVPDRLGAAVLAERPAGPRPVEGGLITLDGEVQSVRRVAIHAAMSPEGRRIGTGLLLLAVLDAPDCAGARLLARCGVDAGRLRAAVAAG